MINIIRPYLLEIWYRFKSTHPRKIWIHYGDLSWHYLDTFRMEWRIVTNSRNRLFCPRYSRSCQLNWWCMMTVMMWVESPSLCRPLHKRWSHMTFIWPSINRWRVMGNEYRLRVEPEIVPASGRGKKTVDWVNRCQGQREISHYSQTFQSVIQSTSIFYQSLTGVTSEGPNYAVS